MTTPVKTVALAAVIISLATGIWGLGWLYERSAQKPAVQTPATVKTENKAEVVWENGKPLADLSFKSAVTSSVAGTTVVLDTPYATLTNPFFLAGRLVGLDSADWQLQDAQHIILAQGMIRAQDASGRFKDMGWYAKRPSSGQGRLLFIQPLSPRSSSVADLAVDLQTKTQTAEIYLWDKSASEGDCSSVFPVKRTLVATREDRTYFYEAALRALMAGPTEQEVSSGLQTALPTSTGLLRVGQDEKGRYVGDFTPDLIRGIDDTCRLAAIKAQISRTLTTVYLPGKSLLGRVFVEGKEVAF